MIFPAHLFIYAAIIAAYYFYKKKKGFRRLEITNQMGLSFSGSGKYYSLAIGIALISINIAWLLLSFFPINPELLQQTSYKNHHIHNFTITAILLIFLKELFFTVLGEELFFRGLVGGYLFNKYSFKTANLLQTIIFLLPHTALLFISIGFYPILIVIAVSAFMLGWLRYKSSSIFPGVLSHTLVNTASIIYFYSNILQRN